MKMLFYMIYTLFIVQIYLSRVISIDSILSFKTTNCSYLGHKENQYYCLILSWFLFIQFYKLVFLHSSLISGWDFCFYICSTMDNLCINVQIMAFWKVSPFLVSWFLCFQYQYLSQKRTIIFRDNFKVIRPIMNYYVVTRNSFYHFFLSIYLTVFFDSLWILSCRVEVIQEMILK